MQPYLLRVWTSCYNPGTCKYCAARIVWAITDQGKHLPLNADYVVEDTVRDPQGRSYDLVHRDHVHFATCPRRPPKPRQRVLRFSRWQPRRRLLEIAES